MARKDVASIVSGAGWIAGFADKLIRALRERSVTDEQIHSLVTDEGEVPMGKIVDMLAEMMRPQNLFEVVVNYALPLAEAIAKGNYDWVNSDITADHFPSAGVDTVKLEAQLYHFNKVIESDDAFKELDQAGLRPATLPELLAFGEQHPNIQKQFPIIALGSVWRHRVGVRRVLGLWSDSYGRYLNLYWFERRWFDDYRFLAVRNSLHSPPFIMEEFILSSCSIRPTFDRFHLGVPTERYIFYCQTLASGVDFLGWVHFHDHRVLRSITRRRMMKKMRDNPKPETVVSYLGLLIYGNTNRVKTKVLEQIF